MRGHMSSFTRMKMWRESRSLQFLLLIGICFTAETRSASLEELDQRCEEARQKKIAPLREAEIEKCLTERNSRDYCERFWRDYGEATRTVNGRFVPRLFNDLPECVEAQKARNSRNRR